MSRSWLDELRWRIGEALARVPGVLRYDGPAPRGDRYVNRINGHVVVRGGAS